MIIENKNAHADLSLKDKSLYYIRWVMENEPEVADEAAQILIERLREMPEIDIALCNAIMCFVPKFKDEIVQLQNSH